MEPEETETPATVPVGKWFSFIFVLYMAQEDSAGNICICVFVLTCIDLNITQNNVQNSNFFSKEQPMLGEENNVSNL